MPQDELPLNTVRWKIKTQTALLSHSHLHHKLLLILCLEVICAVVCEEGTEKSLRLMQQPGPPQTENNKPQAGGTETGSDRQRERTREREGERQRFAGVSNKNTNKGKGKQRSV